jgi:hypothetical protein
MGFFDWLYEDRDWISDGCAPPTYTNRKTGETRSDDSLEKFEEDQRLRDPDYDEKKRVRIENNRLRRRRDFLATQEENIRLRNEIAELEIRAQNRTGRIVQ